MRKARRFVESLLRGRRPRPFTASSEDAAEIRAAITLRSAAPGAGEPSEAFVSRLHDVLAAELSTPDPPTKGQTRRRAIVRTTSIAAASAVVGATAGIVLRGNESQPPPSSQPLDPGSGAWRTVAMSEELPEGGIQPFDLGTVIGFVQRTRGELRAVSGVCTHLGCRLGLNQAVRRLDCPCHKTSFSPDGQVLAHQLPVSPPPLPYFAVREANGEVQVFAPA